MTNVPNIAGATSARLSLVAGGAGFVGSHLCDRLLAEGRTVLCMDSLLTGSIANVSHLMSNPRFTFVRHDIIEPFPVLPRVDEIFNLACAASPPQYQRDPVHTMKTSVVGSINLLDLAVRNGARVLMASTSEIYGDPVVHPQPESYRGNVNTIGPRACYDEGKRAAETLFFDYRRMHGLSIRVARIFNTYGPRMQLDDGRVVSQFIVQALQQDDLTVFGSGSQTRSFCYVDDLVEGLYRLMTVGSDPETPVNLGNPNEMTVRELATLVLSMTGSSSQVTFKELPVDDPRQRRPDIGYAAETLGWAPTVALGDGLESTIAYFRSVLRDGAVAGRSV
jgi:UDP-glucuronate decarboxylase